jgi:DNA-binding NtrC family response regulator
MEMTTKRILILEDDARWKDIIQKAIEGNEFGAFIKIDHAEECMGGMKKLIDFNYDLLISDIGIDDKPGGLCLIRTCSKLRKTIPVIIVSGMITIEEALESLQNYKIEPCDIFLKSEIDLNKFLARVFKKIEDNPNEEATKIEDTIENNNMDKKIKWILFLVIISSFVLIVAGTLAMLFFDFGSPTPEERSVLVKTFIAEIGLCVSTLFYSVFNLRKK